METIAEIGGILDPMFGELYIHWGFSYYADEVVEIIFSSNEP